MMIQSLKFVLLVVYALFIEICMEKYDIIYTKGYEVTNK